MAIPDACPSCAYRAPALTAPNGAPRQSFHVDYFLLVSFAHHLQTGSSILISVQASMLYLLRPMQPKAILAFRILSSWQRVENTSISNDDTLTRSLQTIITSRIMDPGAGK